MAWGNNGAGGLGDGTILQRNAPVTVNGLTGVRAIAAGDGHSLALLENGTVMAWGRNDEGQLGIGTTTGPETCMSELPCSTTPVQVNGLSGVKAIAAGYNDSLALLENGTVMAWGEGQWGQLGNGTEGLASCGDELLCNPTPIAVRGLGGVTAIASGFTQSLALLENGTVMAWGLNGAGQLGIGTTAGPESCGWEIPCSRTPVAVSGLDNVTAIATGGLHDLALLNDGTVMSWGYNLSGQLGDGTNTNRDVPVPVSGLSAVTAVSAGMYDSMAILEGGTAMSWGWNVVWTLGNSSAGEESLVPIPVSGLTGVTAIAAGDSHSLAVAAAPPFSPQVSRVEPHNGPESGGTAVEIAGSNFSGATAIDFGANAAEIFTVNSASSITAVSPPGSGMVHITVTTPAGTSYENVRDRFSYGGARIERVEPDDGVPSGGTPVRIIGSGFEGATAVRFGSTEAEEFEVDSETQITAVSPPGSGTVDVTVEGPAGISPTSSADLFTYGQPEPQQAQPSAELPPRPGSIQLLSCAAVEQARSGSGAQKPRWRSGADWVCHSPRFPGPPEAPSNARELAVRLTRGNVLYATGTATIGHPRARLALSHLRSLRRGRYRLTLAHDRRLRHAIVIIR